MVDFGRESFTEAYGPLWSYPAVSSHDRRMNAVLIGKSGEHLVNSILLRHGIVGYYGGDFSGCDLRIRSPIGDISIRIKTITQRRGEYYYFSMRRGSVHLKGGVREYDHSELAIAALVVLPLNAVRFTADLSLSPSIHVSEINRLICRPQESLGKAIAQLAKRHQR